MSKKKRQTQTHICVQSQSEQNKFKLSNFLLTSDQRLIIMSKLPKLFSLQPIKNFPKKNKNQNNQVKIEIKDKQIEISESLKHSSRVIYKKQRYLIQQNQHGQKEELKTEKRKLEKKQLSDKSLNDVEEDLISQYQKNRQNNNSQIVNNHIDLSIKSNSSIQQIKKQQLQIPIKNHEYKNEKLNNKSSSTQNLLINKQILQNDSQKLTKQQYKKRCFSQIQTQQAQLTFQKQWQILKSLKNHSLIKPFLLPVDQFLDKAKDYYKIIKQPIDLSTIQSKLVKNMYKQPLQFHMDIQRMWMNSFQYNRPLSGMAKITKELKRYYLNLIKAGPPKSLSEKQNKKKRRR